MVSKRNVSAIASESIFFLPALIIYIIVMIIPLFTGLYYSMTDWDGIRKSINYIGFQNFSEAFRDSKLLNATKVTFLFAIVYTSTHNIIGLIAAKIFLKNNALNGFCKASLFLPYVLSTLCVSYIWNYMYSPIDGVINGILAWIGISETPINFLGDPKYALYSAVLTQLWQAFGFTFIIYIAGLKGIPKSYYEAASIDGANGWAKFKCIELPLLAPVTKILLVVDFIACLKLFDLFYIMTKGGPGYHTETYTLMIFREAFSNSRMGYSTAISIILFLIILAATSIQITILNKREVDY